MCVNRLAVILFTGQPAEHVKRSAVKTARFTNSNIDLIADVFRQQVARAFHHVDRCSLHPLHLFHGQTSTKFERSCTTVQGRAEEPLFLEPMHVRGVFVEISWSFCGISWPPNDCAQSVFSFLTSFHGFFMGFSWTD